MARINIDDALLADPRFKALVRVAGSEDLAIGMCFRAFRSGLKYWGDGKLVPERIWKIEGLEQLVEVDLAERREDGVYVRGSSEQFAWYRQRKEAASNGGHARAGAPRDESGRFVAPPHPAGIQPDAGQSPASAQPESSRAPAGIQPTSSPPALAPTLYLKERDKSLSPPNSPPGGSRGAARVSDFDSDLAKRWAEHAVTVMPSLKPELDKWANAIRLMREQDKLSESDIERLFEFVKDDEFWRLNAISPIAIRGRSKNGLKKIENIRLRMQSMGKHQSEEEFGDELMRLIEEKEARRRAHDAQ